MNHFSYNTTSFELVNKNFIESVSSLLDDYFAPERLDALDSYIPIGEYNEAQAKTYSTDGGSQINITKAIDKVSIAFPKEFSPYENILFSHFFYGTQKTYVISGAMGSGKSSSVNYVLDFSMGQEEYKDTFYIKIDFSEGYAFNKMSDVDRALDVFRENLFEILKAELIEKIAKFTLATDFLLHIQKNYRKFPRYYDLQFENITTHYEHWAEMQENEKVFYIFKYIDEKCKNDLETKVEMLMYFLKYINTFLENKKIRAIIFYDNIDKLPPAIQRAILLKITSYNEISRVIKIITARRSTKAKLDKIRDNTHFLSSRAQYPYGHIYHHGPSPTHLFISKLKKIINEIQSIKILSSIDVGYKNQIVARANEVLEKLNSNSQFQEIFSSISGECNRIGLTLATRPFCNYVIPYNDKSLNQQSLTRTLFVSTNINNRMSLDDKYVCNLFSDGDYKFSYINIVILSLLKKASKEDFLSKYSNVVNIYDILLEYCHYTSHEIVTALNYLMSDKRALVGGEYFPGYEDADQLLRSNDKLRVTELGDKYFSQLYKVGSPYIETCLLSVKWPFLSKEYPTNDTILNRFKDLRACVQCVKQEEDDRIVYFEDFNRKVFTFDFNSKSIAVTLGKNICHSLMNISPYIENSEFLKEEFNVWHYIITSWSHEHHYLKKLLITLEKHIESLNK